MAKLPKNSGRSDDVDDQDAFNEEINKLARAYNAVRAFFERDPDDINKFQTQAGAGRLVGKLSATQLRRLLDYAWRTGVVVAVPPVDIVFANQLAAAAGLSESRVIIVGAPHVDPATTCPLPDDGFLLSSNKPRQVVGSNDPVAQRAARLVAQRMLEIGEINWPKGLPVTIAVSSGRSGALFCAAFAHLLSIAAQYSGRNGAKSKLASQLLNRGPIKLVSLTAVALPHESIHSAAAGFSMFHGLPQCETISFNAHNLISAGEFDAGTLQKTPGFRHAYAERDNIDIAVTAVGAIHDVHDNLRRCMEDANVSLAEMLAEGFYGTFSFRPFGLTGPVVERLASNLRVACVLELDDFARMVREGKEVVVMVRSCRPCHPKDRADVLVPLLTEKGLRLANNFVIDGPSAKSAYARVAS
jgi:hypothetical protein